MACDAEVGAGTLRMGFNPEHLPIDAIGGEQVALRLAETFYDIMERSEPALVASHRQEPVGKIHPESRKRFGLFLVGWLGGKQTYMETYGHPRLRMRHAQVAIDSAMRDAWVRCMYAAMDEVGVAGDVRTFLETRFFEVADFLRNVPEAKK